MPLFISTNDKRSQGMLYEFRLAGEVITKPLGIFSVKRLYLIYSIPLILTICLLSVFDVFQRPDLYFLDRAFQLRGAREPTAEVAIVAVTQRDFELGAPRWPWARSLMARLIDQVSSHQPAVIAIDILYTESSNTEALITRDQFADIQPFLYQVLSGVELEIQSRDGTQVVGPGSPFFDHIISGTDSPRAQDLELADAVQQAIGNGVAVVLAAEVISDGRVVGLAEPYPALSAAAGDSIGLVGIRLDADGVLRRHLPYGLDKDGGFIYSLALTAVAEFRGLDLPETPLANGDVQLGDDLLVKIDNGQFLINLPGPPGTNPVIVARDVLRGDQDFSEQLKDKIVFVGVTDPSAEDLHPSAFSGTYRMAGVEFQAAAAGTLLSESFIGTAPRYQEFLILVVLGIGAMALGRFPRPLLGFGGALVLAGGLFGTWIGSFVWVNHLLPITSPLTAVIMGYAFATIDRVSVEQVEKQQARSMLSRYIAPGMVKEMLKNPIAAQLGGKRADLTVLFSDIRGFTTLSERLAPEEVVSLLNEYLALMTEIIFQNEGTVYKFEGDAILAFFGAPQSHDDDPERAIRTALEMQDRLVELEDKWKERTGASLRIGIGINTGEAVVGNIGSERKMEYTVIGDTVNLASRLQDLTKEYGIPLLFSGSTQAKVKEMFPVRFIDSIQVRGRQQSVDLYTVVDKSDDAVQDDTAPATVLEEASEVELAGGREGMIVLV